ncbi:MAG TPA: energy transducer TonB [Bacteroidia bacterium]|nr:energy transducer TonB [Bacteroidia bacterium]HNT79088.1 energy transducer TonB [Bacteroidia bacterium]
MEAKKSDSANLEKQRKLFFQIGLAAALGVTLLAFEWKSYDGSAHSLGQLNIDDVPEEMIPITKQEEKLPPPPPPVVEVLNIVEDDKVIENEAVIEDTEADQNTVVVEVKNTVEEVDEPEIFLVVENPPSFPGGEAALVKFLQNNIKYPAIARENNITGRVYLTFVVDPTGSIKDLKILRGVHPAIDEEAVRVVKSMPKWSPGKQRGKAVSVQFNLPVNFSLK